MHRLGLKPKVHEASSDRTTPLPHLICLPLFLPYVLLDTT